MYVYVPPREIITYLYKESFGWMSNIALHVKPQIMFLSKTNSEIIGSIHTQGKNYTIVKMSGYYFVSQPNQSLRLGEK